VSSFLFRAATPEAAADLRQAPLVAQLVQSTRAYLMETIVADESQNDGLQNAGVVIVDNNERTPAGIAELLVNGARRLLCVPINGTLPHRVIIYCPDDSPQNEAMGLVASLVRHINAEATFVTVLNANANPAARTLTLRNLLDTRAQVRSSHGLDLRTEVRTGDVAAELRELVAGPEPALLVMGISGDRANVEAILQREVGWIFTPESRCPLLLSYSGPSAAPVMAR
jgi:hypothetical protein